MKREFLKALNLDDEIINKIMDENGKDINAEKAKFADYDTLKTQLTTANEQLKTANGKIEELGKLDYDGLKATADKYKADFEKAQADSKKQLEELQYNHALDGALTTAKVRNSKAITSLLDREKIKYNKDGSFSGLDEQLEALKKSDGYLFEVEDPKPSFLGGSGGGGSNADDNSIRAVMGLPPINK